jgi:predicted outer membrane repeat protein
MGGGNPHAPVLGLRAQWLAAARCRTRGAMLLVRPLLLCVACALPLAGVTAQVTFVDARATGANNGTSWADAYVDLNAALAATTAGEVWVAAGTYRPAPPNGSRAASFALRSGVALFGGFAGTETLRHQRRPEAQPTILSGDLNGDDGPNWAGMQENSLSVVTARNVDGTAVLDGFVVRAAYAGFAMAGGVGVDAASPVVRGCAIQTCMSGHGGGVLHVNGGTLVLEDCRLEGNYASYGNGGGLYAGTGTTARVARCRFTANLAKGSSAANGGAVHVDLGATLLASDCAFVRNEANYRFGPGFYPASGGAISTLGVGCVLERCLFLGNLSDAGGALYAYKDATIRDCVFDANRAVKAATSGGAGGAILAGWATTVTITGTTIWGNSATEDGGGIYASTATLCTLANDVLWGNRDVSGSVGQSQCKGTRQRWCCVQNMLVPPAGGDPVDPLKFPDCTDRDPRCVDPLGPDRAAGTEDDDFQLQAGSPCIDRGDPAFATTALDRARSPRVLDGDLDRVMRTDLGAFEHAPARLALAVTPLPNGGHRVQAGLTGAAGLQAFLAAGRPGVPFLLPPAGPIYVDAGAPFVVVPAGTIPNALAFDAPPGAFDLVLQVLAASGGGAVVASNPEAFSVR